MDNQTRNLTVQDLLQQLAERDERIQLLTGHFCEVHLPSDGMYLPNKCAYCEAVHLDDQLKFTQARLAEAETALKKIRDFGVPSEHLIACMCVFCWDTPQTVADYFAKHEKESHG